MAKLQIFVLVVALSQVYGNVVISTLPGVLGPQLRPEVVPEIVPEQLPQVPEIVSPPCVASIRALLEAILERLPGIEVPRPLPVDPEHPEVTPELPELPEVEVEVEDEELEPEVPALVTPCSACFEHINGLLTTAEKVLAIRRMSQMLRM